MTPRSVRIFYSALCAAIGSMGLLAPAGAQDFPSKAVRLIVAFPPGGGTDAVARAIAVPLAQKWGQAVIVDNRPGGGTIIATELTKRAAPDGHTLLIVDPSFAINPGLVKNLPYDPHKDFEPVTIVAKFPLILVAHPSLPATSVSELIALARAKPGSVTYASSGVGGATHLAGEIFKSMSGADIVHVPYKGGGPAVLDLLAGRVSIFFSGVAVLPHVRSGKLRALALGNASRSAFTPEIPTVSESGLPGFEIFSWQGVFAPAGVPKPIVAKIQSDMAAAANQPSVKSQLATLGVEPVTSTPAEFAAYLKGQLSTYAEVIRAAGIKPE
jgi:tripartite-type tricarboxylate transporter receptor subunit TctC